MVRVIEGVAGHWEDLALALHFETSMIEIVNRDMFHKTENSCRELLRRWLEGQGGTRQPVNWATLIESLIDAGFFDVADDLREVVEDPPLLQDRIVLGTKSYPLKLFYFGPAAHILNDIEKQ